MALNKLNAQEPYKKSNYTEKAHINRVCCKYARSCNKHILLDRLHTTLRIGEQSSFELVPTLSLESERFMHV